MWAATACATAFRHAACGRSSAGASLAIAAAVLIGCAMTPQAATRADTRAITIAACAACHGVDGVAPDSEVPHLAGQNERYLLNQLLAFRSGRRLHKEMRFMARELTTAEMAAIAAYYAALPPR
jgi:cytochrome c553